jgi:N-acetylglutamate synthase-like GNAT family acetyltransferase
VIVVRTGGHHPEEVRRILAEVPGWFGLPESNEEYVEKASTLTNVVARDGHEVVGICLLLQHNPTSVEIDLLAVPATLHRRGVGRAILEHVERDLRATGVRLLHLKTLGPSRDDEGYARTRAFYEAMGFLPMEERTDIWDPSNPALFLVKVLV